MQLLYMDERFKVETIGDAYMVVSGVPIQTTMHAQPVADFAIDMVAEAAKVNSPATGKPLQVGIFSLTKRVQVKHGDRET